MALYFLGQLVGFRLSYHAVINLMFDGNTALRIGMGFNLIPMKILREGI